MKLYTKKLHTVEELEREKRKLRRDAKQLDKEPFFSKLRGDSAKEKSSSSSPLDFLSNPMASIGLKMFERFMDRKKAAPARERQRMYADVAPQAKSDKITTKTVI